MRKIHNQQLPLVEATTDHPKAIEFARISEVLEKHNSICELALQDFDHTDNNAGASTVKENQNISNNL